MQQCKEGLCPNNTALTPALVQAESWQLLHLLSPAKITWKCHSADNGLSYCFSGQSGLGKSTLINTLFKSKISRKSVQPTSEERIPKTIEIKSITHGEAPHIPAGALAFGPAVPCVLLNLCSHLPKWAWSV